MVSKPVYRCKQDMVCAVGGQRRHFSRGDLVVEDHPVKPKSNPNFEEISEYVERTSKPRHRGVVVEQATAEPGEKRRVGRPRGKSKPKPDPVDTPAEQQAPTEAPEEGA